MRTCFRLFSVVALLVFQISASAQVTMAPEDVVRAEVRAFADGDLNRLLAVFSPDAVIFALPENPDRLVGPLSTRAGTQERRTAFFQQVFSNRPLQRTEIVDTVIVGDLAAVVLRDSDPPDFQNSEYVFSVHRIADGQIRDLWQIATDTVPASANAMDVIRRLVLASNEGDVESFLQLFSPDSKLFRVSNDPHGLADQLSERMSNQESRRATITAAFRNGPPGQAEIVDILAFGDLVVSRDRVTLPTGQVVHQMKIYRVRDGLITHDWTAYEKAG